MAPDKIISEGSPPGPSPVFLRLSAGFVYFHFGLLKFFPDLSDAELIAGQSIMRLSNYWLDANTALWWLAVMECGIGLSFLFNVGLHWVFFLFLAHQASTFVPLFMFPELTFKFAPFAPTIEGQYILKNLVSIAAGWTIMLPSVKARWKRNRPAGNSTGSLQDIESGKQQAVAVSAPQLAVVQSSQEIAPPQELARSV